MTQLRQDPGTREWVIIAAERAKRPKDFTKAPRAAEDLPPTHDPKCPFCPGNEGMTPPEVLAYADGPRQPNGPDWKLRVIPNKFAAVSFGGSQERYLDGMFRSMDGLGSHEVVVETPRHDLSIGTMPVERVQQVLAAYRDRLSALNSDERVSLVTIFRNHGVGAGTSLVHPHSQIVATPVVPLHVRHRLDAWRDYYDDNGSCSLCDMLAAELEAETRVVMQTDHFAVICPFASRSPMETLIIPKAHRATLGTDGEGELADLARVLSTLMGAFHEAMSDPDYNYVVRTAPSEELTADYIHWSVKVVPRLSTPAGFEIGSGMYINATPPEDAAAFLREAIEAKAPMA